MQVLNSQYQHSKFLLEPLHCVSVVLYLLPWRVDALNVGVKANRTMDLHLLEAGKLA